MKGQMMPYALSTQSIIEYGNRVFPRKTIVSRLPDGAWHRYTYADMYLRAKKMAGALLNKLNVQPGDRVATFAWNHYQHLELYYAIPGCGAVCHTINIRLSVDQIAYIINHADDTIIFIDASLIKLFEQVVPKIKSNPQYIIMHASADFETSLNHVLHYEDLLAESAPLAEWIAMDENDACGLCYTTGTTGEPKGVLYSHRSTYLHALAIMTPNAFNISCSEKVLLIVPQFHVMAWGFPFVCVMAGADIVLPSCHLQPAALIEIIQKEQVTIANGVPAIWMGIYEILKKRPPAEKLSLKEYLVGGSAMPVSVMDAFEREFGITGVQAWGMTETSPLGTVSRLQQHHYNLPKEEQLKIRSTQGIELPGVEIRSAKEDGTIAARDGETTGEFEIRGPWIMDTYFGSEKQTDRTGNDWFKTGDTGTINKDGYMQITDRKKDLIKSGGEWISSIALELSLVAHPKITEACVIAIPDERWTERPLACIVFAEGETVTAAELKSFLNGKFAAYQLPDRYVFLQNIPKTSVGKLDKKELRRLYAAGELV
ncbi:MAG: long-chain fatty acid--CoA ligase [Chitinophagaceae bacterium]